MNKEDIMGKVEQAMIAHVMDARKGHVDYRYKAILLQALDALRDEFDFLKDQWSSDVPENVFVHHMSLIALLAADESYISVLEDKK